MIRLENVTKYYPTPNGRHYVLRNVSLEIPDGAKVGVIGRNGAGKTSLLKLIGGVDIPNEGRIVRTGFISWPLGLGSGLQKSMSGRENARFCCRIQGVTRDGIPAMVERMRELSGLGKFFDLPVKTYSSGMKARLKFALAMSFDFDCYIIDELTSVGDASFKIKSKRMFEEKRNRASFIKVSHSLPELLEDCNCGIVIEDGVLHPFNSIEEAVDFYRKLIGDDEEPRPARGRRGRRESAEDEAAHEEELMDAVVAGKSPRRRELKKQQRRATKEAKRTAKRSAKTKSRAARAPAGEKGSAREGAGRRRVRTGDAQRRAHRPAPMAPRPGRPEGPNS
jgi:capsular polysaccharide transport system ATP-binding protein